MKKGFMEYSTYMDDVYKNIENYNPGKICSYAGMLGLTAAASATDAAINKNIL